MVDGFASFEMWSGLQPDPSNVHNWYGPIWRNDTFTVPLSPHLPFDRYGAGGWVGSDRQYNFIPDYHQPGQRPASFGLPSQMSSYQPVGYIYHSNGNIDSGRMPQQPGPFHSVSQGEWSYGYAFASSRYQGHPSSESYALEDRRLLEPSLASTVSRGPPLKPRRSGHSLWVGNLHPTTSIIALKNHFSQHMTEDIESVFLIARSTCAFVNYRSEQACKFALIRFHSSRLSGNSLVCRIRREPGAGGGLALSTPSSPSSAQGSGFNSEDGSKNNTAESPTTPVIVGMNSAAISSLPTVPVPISPKVPTRFFILKSLTVQDLEASVRKSSWVTQAKNEAALNNAFQEAETVYLIFSANRSGEYFGFARMTSAISVEERSLSTDPSNDPAERSPLMAPIYIDTPATASAPKGRIVDDSARGTLFWEACSPEGEGSDDKLERGAVLSHQMEGVRRTWARPLVLNGFAQ